MKKIANLFVLITVLLCITGCRKEHNIDKIKYQNYLAYYEAILNTQEKSEDSEYFDVELVVNKISDTSYRYDVIIDNPKVAMYDIKCLAIIDVLSTAVDSELMMPSIGIIDDETYNMVPGQIDKDNNFVGGLDLSVLYEKPQCRISLVIIWNDKNQNNEKRQYLTLYKEYTSEQDVQE